MKSTSAGVCSFDRWHRGARSEEPSETGCGRYLCKPVGSFCSLSWEWSPWIPSGVLACAAERGRWSGQLWRQRRGRLPALRETRQDA